MPPSRTLPAASAMLSKLDEQVLTNEILDRHFNQKTRRKEIVTWLQQHRRFGPSYKEHKKAQKRVRDAISEAILAGRVAFQPPHNEDLRGQVRRAAKLSEFDAPELTVIDADSPVQVARRMSGELRRLIEQSNQEHYTVGLFGGRTNSLVMQAFANGFRGGSKAPPPKDLKRTLTVVSLVGALAGNRPDTNPNSYPMHLDRKRSAIERKLKRRLVFSDLPAPGLVTPSEWATARGLSMTRDRFGPAPRFDAIICSCGHLGCQYTLLDYADQAVPDGSALKAAVLDLGAKLKGQGVIGDVAWHPVSPAGPVDPASLPVRVMTRFDLHELAALLGPDHPHRPAVLLAMGPCSDPGCRFGSTKGALLQWVLAASPPPVTHVFADSLTAAEYLDLARAPR